jgi:hypothetical protein
LSVFVLSLFLPKFFESIVRWDALTRTYICSHVPDESWDKMGWL